MEELALGSTARHAERIENMRTIRQGSVLAAALLAGALFSTSAQAIEACRNDHSKRTTCIVDGDTGWESGRKWRLLSIDAPELSHPDCPAERKAAIRSRDRLAELMGGGYRIVESGRTDPYGRALVDITLANGKDAGGQLMNEGLAQPWPNKTNPWCKRR